MTKKQFNRLLKQTKEHWKNDILKAPVKLLRQETPILAKKCAVCKFFTDNYRKNGCWECFLRGGALHCMKEVNDANRSILVFQDSGCSIAYVRKYCRIAYKAILQRFADYEKKHFA